MADIGPTLPPEDDIGPFYMIFGALALIGGIVLIILEVHKGQAVSTLGIIRFGILMLVCLALIRPRKFDEVIKSFVDLLPMFSFRKD